jgi:hypothetical protein
MAVSGTVLPPSECPLDLEWSAYSTTRLASGETWCVNEMHGHSLPPHGLALSFWLYLRTTETGFGMKWTWLTLLSRTLPVCMKPKAFYSKCQFQGYKGGCSVNDDKANIWYHGPHRQQAIRNMFTLPRKQNVKPNVHLTHFWSGTPLNSITYTRRILMICAILSIYLTKNRQHTEMKFKYLEEFQKISCTMQKT